jgi:uncharacterized protein YcbK (DUF882 family)
MQLSPNFTLDELTHSDLAVRKGIDNSPGMMASANLVRLANLLEQVRKCFGKPIMINSGFRCKTLNDAVGSKDTSQHMIGCAADIRISGMTPDEVVKAIIQSDIQFDQMIREFDSWVHISVTNRAEDTPRNQILIIDKQGTRPYK